MSTLADDDASDIPVEGSNPEPTDEPGAPVDAASGPVGEGAVEPEDELSSSLDGFMEALRQARVAELLLSTISTLASVGYGKLEHAELAEAKLAIDAVGALVPLLQDQLDAGIVREVEQALTDLRLAYADAIPKAQ